MTFHFWKALVQILNFMTVFTIAHLKNHEYCALRVLFTSSIVIVLPSSLQTFKISLNLQRKAVSRKERPK